MRVLVQRLRSSSLLSMRRVGSISGWAMVWSGLLMLGIVGYQLVITDVVNSAAQAAGRETVVEQLAERQSELPEPVLVEQPQASATEAIEQVVFHQEDLGDEGEPVGGFRIPAIEVDQVVFEGVTASTLKNGPGHMPWTPLPGQPGNAVISGHRTTYGAPFYDLDLLEAGDVIEVDTAVGTHIYTVRESIIVAPTDVWVTEPRDGAWLTLTTCHPKLSARERLIVFAELTGGPNLDYVELLSNQVPGA